MRKCIVYSIIFVMLMALLTTNVSASEKAPQTSAGEAGVDYPISLCEKTYEQYPKEFSGFYERMRYMKVEDNDLMTRIISIVDSCDVNKIFNISDFSIGFLCLYAYDYPSEERKKIFIPRYTERPHETIDINSDYLEIYVESTELIDINTKYCFACGKHIIFSDQWIHGLFRNMNNYIKTILSWLILLPKTAVWRFVVQDGVITESSVCLSEFFDSYTPIFHFETGVMEKIPMYRE